MFSWGNESQKEELVRTTPKLKGERLTGHAFPAQPFPASPALPNVPSFQLPARAERARTEA